MLFGRSTTQIVESPKILSQSPKHFSVVLKNDKSFNLGTYNNNSFIEDFDPYHNLQNNISQPPIKVGSPLSSENIMFGKKKDSLLSLFQF